MKLLKRLLLLVAVLLTIIVSVGLVGLFLFRAEPQWYRRPSISAEEREAAAQRATNKLAMIQNQAARARLQQNPHPPAAGNSPTPAPATQPTDPPTLDPPSITVSFTDQELNAFFDKWSSWNNWKAVYEQHLSDPVLILNNGRLILAARVKELNTVASLHFAPRIDEQGRLNLVLEQVRGGRLPLPQGVFSEHRRKLILSMHSRLPYWRQTAALDQRTGAPNSSAICATMGTLLVNVLSDRPADPILFLPLVDHGAVPVKLTEVDITGGTLSLTVEALTLAERHELLARIRDGTTTAMGR